MVTPVFTDPFVGVVGSRRGLNPAVAERREEACLRQEIEVAASGFVDNDFTRGFALLLRERKRVRTHVALSEFADTLCAAAAQTLVLAAYGGALPAPRYRASPLRTMGWAVGLRDRESTILADPRLAAALPAALDAGLASRLRKSERLGVKMALAWEEVLLDITVEEVFASDDALVAPLYLSASYRAQLPPSMPAFREFVDRSIYRTLIKPWRCNVSYARGFSVESNNKQVYLGGTLWPLLFAGLAGSAYGQTLAV